MSIVVALAFGAGQLPKWELVPELRIGAVDDPDLALSEVSAIAVAKDGTIYAAQPQDNLVRVFDAEGRPVRTIGRQGSGPGEFRLVVHIAWVGDTLWAADLRLGRISLFGRDGTHIGSLAMGGVDGLPLLPNAFLADGSIVGTRALGPVGGVAGSRAPVIRASRTGSILDTLAWRDVRNARVQLEFGGRAGRATMFQPVRDHTLLMAAPDGASLAVVERAVPRDGRGHPLR